MKRRLFALFGATLLIGHMLLTALVPIEVLLLSGHDHIVLGSVSQEAWRAHEQAHMQMAMMWHNHPAPPTAPVAQTPQHDTGEIVSVPGCDLNGLMARSAALQIALLQRSSPFDVLCQESATPSLPKPQARLIDLRVPHPPPRLAFA